MAREYTVEDIHAVRRADKALAFAAEIEALYDRACDARDAAPSRERDAYKAAVSALWDAFSFMSDLSKALPVPKPTPVAKGKGKVRA